MFAIMYIAQNESAVRRLFLPFALRTRAISWSVRPVLLFLLLLLFVIGCARKVQEYTLTDTSPTSGSGSAASPEVPQVSTARSSDEPTAEASTAVTDRPATAPKRERASEPSNSEQAEDEADSVEHDKSRKDSEFFIAPEQLDTAALGQMLLRRGLSNRDPILVVAAVKILSTTSDPGSNTSFSEHLNNAAHFGEADDALVPMLVEHVRDYTDSGQALTVQANNEQWEVGTHGLTDVGLGEIVFRYGLKRGDPLSRVAGLLVLAGAVEQPGAPTPKQLNQRIQTFLNEVNEPIWIMLADRVYDVIDHHSTQEMQQRPGEDWATFLGPTTDGRSTEVQLVREWPWKGPPIVWQFDAGNGFATCSIQGGSVYLFDRVNDYNRLVYINQETGEIQGEPFTYPAPTESLGGYLGPRCSPVLDGDRVYIFDEAGMLHCLRAGTTEAIWKIDIAREFGVVANRFGVAATPMIVGNLLIATVGGGGFESSSTQTSTRTPKPNGSAIVAFDKLTGEVAYASGNFLADYASPVSAEIGGVQWGFSLLREGLVGFAPASGKIASYYPWRPEDLSSANCASPVVIGDEIFLSNAFGQGSALLKVEPSRFTQIWADDPASSEKKFEAYFSTPVYHDGYLYGCSGKESHRCELRCINWSTGEVMWSEPGLNRTSLIFANGQLLCLSEYGILYLVEATPEEYRLVSKVTLQGSTPDRIPPGFTVPNLLEYPCWAAPVLSRGYLYLRSPKKLVCLDLSLPEAMNQQPMASSQARVVSVSPSSLTNQVEPLEIPAPSGAQPVPLKRYDVEPSTALTVSGPAPYMPIERTRLVKYEPAPKGWMGVIGDSTGANRIASVDADSPAQQAGLRAGDTILSVDGYSTDDFASVSAELKMKTVGQSVSVVVRRNGAQRTISAVLGTLPPPAEWNWSIGGIRYRTTLLSVEGDNVTFKVSNGNELSYKLSDLSETSRKRIKDGMYSKDGNHGKDGKYSAETKRGTDDPPTQSPPRNVSASSAAPAQESSARAAPDDPTGSTSSSDKPLIESRKWTNTEGKTIEAAVISIHNNKVTFLRSDGKRSAYPIAELSDTDKELVDIVRRVLEK